MQEAHSIWGHGVVCLALAAELGVGAGRDALRDGEQGGGLVALDVDDVDVGLVHRLEHAQARVYPQTVSPVDPCARAGLLRSAQS